MPAMSPAEYGEHLAAQLPPITDEQAEKAALVVISSATP